MQLSQSPKINLNYAARIVEIKDFVKHPNPKCERLKCCAIEGYSIAVGIDTTPGTYVYFPMECAIDKDYLSVNNLFRDKEKNADKTKSGFFEDGCRVKALRLQGYPSEGFIMPIESLYMWIENSAYIGEIISNLKIGYDFDMIDEHQLCKKYVPKSTRIPGQPGNGEGGNITKKLRTSKVIDTQFRFHYNTTLIKKCPHVIEPDSLISITEKVHGTSGISAYILCTTEVSRFTKFVTWFNNNLLYPINRLFGGQGYSISQTEGYDYLWSSRSVVKNQFYNEGVTSGFYGCDVWKYAHDIVQDKLVKGMTLYYEIIGYLPNGGAIQKANGSVFDYMYVPPTKPNEYVYGTHFGIVVYRVTYTNPDGRVFEFSARQVQQWCEKNGLQSVRQYYYGYAKDLYPDLDISNHWNENFMARLASDPNFYMEMNSPTCNNDVPHEGIVIKIENFLSEAYKLKCFKFLEKETKALDKGEIDIESES